MTWGGPARASLERNAQHQRWHFQHGPIDLIIGLQGATEPVDAALAKAWQRFQNLLGELVNELRQLKSPVSLHSKQADLQLQELQGPVARRMFLACAPYALEEQRFVTPMAAVAGSVAQEILAYFQAEGIKKAWVNNGGDIAWHAPLVAGEPVPEFEVGLPEVNASGKLTLRADAQAWGIATSGWRGRSQSLGIADSVTVIAGDATKADVAATMIANCVSLQSLGPEHPQVLRRPASEVKDGSDLGEQWVTVGVGPLSDQDIWIALEAGLDYAQTLVRRGWIKACVLSLQGHRRQC
jgi:uncharacterized protein